MRPALCPARASLLIFLVLVLPSPGKAVVSGGGDPLATETYDIRVFGGAALARLEEAYAFPRLITAEAKARDRARSLAEASERLRSLAPGARIELSPLPTGIEVVASAGTPLTVAEPGLDGAAVVRGFLRSWPGIYGLSPEQIEHLEVLSESRQDGLTVVRLRQTVNGRPVFQSDTRAVLDRERRLLHTVGRLIPAIDEAAVPTEWRVGSRETLQAALASVGSDLDLVTRPATSEQVYFPLAPGVLVPAWAHVAFTRGPADWYTVVDARTGTLLWRKNIRYNLAAPDADTLCAEVYTQGGNTPADSPAPHDSSKPDPGELPQIIKNSTEINLPNASLKDHELINKNVIAFLDRNGSDSADTEFPLTQATKRKSKKQESCVKIPFFSSNQSSLPQAAPKDYSSGAVANLFYLVSWFHDRLSDLGFNKVARNFEDDDPVLAEAQYAAEVDEGFGIFNLASFSAPPDGSSGLLRLSVWDGPDPDRDASLDAQIVFHELAHGVTSRLIGNGACLNWYPGRALAEGWSDFYALALLNSATDDDPAGVYSVGGYTAYKLGGHDDFTDNYLFGLRRFPYSTNMSFNPLTWKDADDTTTTVCRGPEGCTITPPSPLGWENSGAYEIHNAGELWALSLWEMRSQIINSLEEDDRISKGNEIALRIVTKSLTLEPMPCDPSFIEARNRLIDADCDSDESCPNETTIWQGFAKRGLGYGARDSGGVATHFGIHESFHVPFLDLDPADPQIEIESDGESYVVPNTKTTITVHLRNPWLSKAASAKAILNCTSPNVKVVTEGPVQYGPIEKQEEDSATFIINVLQTATAGEALGCRLTLDDLDPVDPFSTKLPEVDLNLRVGQRDGTDTLKSCTWNKAGEATGTLACKQIACSRPFDDAIPDGEIPDGDLRGRCFTVEVNDDFVVESIALQINDLTHPWIGDLTVLLKGPNGYGTELIYRLAKDVIIDLDTPNKLNLGTLLGANDLRCLGCPEGSERCPNVTEPTGTRIKEGGEDFLGMKGLLNNACFAGEWAPSLESTSWLKPSTDQLDRFHGISSKGTWTLFITDAVPDGNGKGDPAALLNSWSLEITPASYTTE